MALSANTVWEVRPAGSGAADTNGGGFVTGSGGTDYSQQDSPQLTVTDGSCSATTTLTSATGGFTSAMVGNILYLSSGPGWYQITAFTDTNTVTLDRAGPSASGMTVNVGGALATPGGFGAVWAAHGVSGMSAWLATGTYTLSGATVNTAGGPINLNATTGRIDFEGYNTTRGDRGTPPVINAGTQTALTLFKMAGAIATPQHVVNVKVDGNSQTSITGFDSAEYGQGPYLCVATACTTGFHSANSRGQAVRCQATTCGTGFSANLWQVSRCLADSCTTVGFAMSSQERVASRCIADSCAIGFNGASGFQCVFDQCIAYNSTGDGFRLDRAVALACIAYGNGGYGFDTSTSTRSAILINCAAGSNTSGNTDGSTSRIIEENLTALTADPFVDAASGDFNINNTAGGGAALRAVTIAI